MFVTLSRVFTPKGSPSLSIVIVILIVILIVIFREAVRRLLDMGHKAGIIPKRPRVEWV